MTASDEYCEFCDLPMAQCIHGQPPAPKPVAKSVAKSVAKPAPKPRKRAAATPRTATTTRKPVSRRWTAPEALRPDVLAVLEKAGGELEADELFLELEIVLQDRLLPGDRELTPEGEPRWQYAARRARVALINEGVMTKGVPGVWKLAETP
jgi:hypothetical protein